MTTTQHVRSVISTASRHPLAIEVVLAPLALGIVFAIAFGHSMRSGTSTATFLDNTHLFLPLFGYISHAFARGEYPYWVNSILGGMRLYDSPQFSVEYPLYFFRAHLYMNPADAIFDAENIIRLHLFIAYLNTYILMRVLRLPPIAAFLGASLFVISPNLYYYAYGAVIIAPYAWFPMVIASVYLILENVRPKAGVLLGIFSLSMLVLASPSQPLIHVVYMIVILYFCAAFFRWRSNALRSMIPITANLALMGVIAFTLASPILIPLLRDSGGMLRFVGDFPPVYGLAKVSIEATTVGQYRVADMAGIFWPFGMPGSQDQFFVGVSAFTLALFGLFKLRSNWVIVPVTFIAIYALFSSTGTNTWFGYLNYHLPLLDKIREPGRHLMLFVLGISILAGLGVSYLVEKSRVGFRDLLTWKHGLVVVVAVSVSFAASFSSLPYIGSVSRLALGGLFALPLALFALLPYCRASWSRLTLTASAVLLIVLANAQYPWSAPRLQDGDYFAAANLASHKALAEVARIRDVAQYRVIVNDDRLSPHFWAMNGMYYDVRSFQAFMNPMPSALQFDQVFQRFGLRHYYPLLGGKYYLCRPCDAHVLRDYTYERSINGMKLYAARDALPRYAILNAVAGSFQAPNDFYAKVDAGYDFNRRVYLGAADERPVSTWLGAQAAPPQYVLKEEHASPNRLEVSVNMTDRAIFLLNEYDSSDWQAMVNGTPAPVFNINLNQMGVLLDKGANIVEFEYFPKLYVALLALQRITFVVLLLYVLWLARARLIRGRGREAGAAP